MQIQRITQPILCKPTTTFKATNSVQPETSTASGIQPAENYGRAMINFKSIATHTTLTKRLITKDKKFIDNLAKILNLSKEKTKELRQDFKSYLTENKYKSFSDLKFSNNDNGLIEECECIGNLTDRFSQKLGLNENEADILNIELLKRVEEGSC